VTQETESLLESPKAEPLIGPFYVQVRTPDGREFRIENCYALEHGGIRLRLFGGAPPKHVDGVPTWTLADPDEGI
jgi:hypothetical protein